MPKLQYINKNFHYSSRVVIRQANTILEEYAAQGYDLTLRQLYYQFVARGLIENKQSEYNKLGNIVNDARLAGLIDWNHITDRTRNLRAVPFWADPSEIIEESSEEFCLDLWADQEYRCEVWIEKDALTGVIAGACNRLRVPWFSCRGYTSQSEMWLAAQRLRRYMEAGQKVIVFHFGDHDPSGIDMTRDIEDRLFLFMQIDHWRSEGETDEAWDSMREWVTDNFELRRIALNMAQVDLYNPPPNFAKVTDSRYGRYVAAYGEDSWELDALEPSVITELITENVVDFQLIDEWNQARSQEREHRELLSRVSDQWEDVVEFLKEV